MASRGYLDIGAQQRPEGGSAAVRTGYLDIGAVQRQESPPTMGYIRQHSRRPAPFAPGNAR